MAVRIMNKGKAPIQFGKTKEESFLPGAIAKVNDEIAEKHMRLYPKILINIDNVESTYDGTEVKDLTAKEVKVKSVTAKKSESKSDAKDDALADALKSEKTEK
jgi:hypothetical protein